jgi:hypothetical protein
VAARLPQSKAMARQPIDPAELARISGAMLKALAEARALNAAGDSSDELRALVRHARDMHDLLLENLIAAEPGTAQYARGLADSMANHLDDLERLLEPDALQGAGARGTASSH